MDKILKGYKSYITRIIFDKLFNFKSMTTIPRRDFCKASAVVVAAGLTASLMNVGYATLNQGSSTGTCADDSDTQTGPTITIKETQTVNYQAYLVGGNTLWRETGRGAVTTTLSNGSPLPAAAVTGAPAEKESSSGKGSNGSFICPLTKTGSPYYESPSTPPGWNGEKHTSPIPAGATPQGSVVTVTVTRQYDVAPTQLYTCSQGD